MSARASIDVAELEAKVKQMYQAVAQSPAGAYHFEMGRGLAERLGYPPAVLDRVPAGAIESFAGVGYFFDLAELRAGETVLGLGSGSGMGRLLRGTSGRTGRQRDRRGHDPAQLDKAEMLRAEAGLGWVTFTEAHIEDLPVRDASIDAVISNGVINLCPNTACTACPSSAAGSRPRTAGPGAPGAPRSRSPRRVGHGPRAGGRVARERSGAAD